MTENGIERAEKAVETLVYGTVGLALYVRDTAPSFIKLFVARGKNELGQQSEKVVADPLAQVRSLGDLAAQSAPQILRVFGDQVGRLRERAEDVIAGFGTPPGTPGTPPPYSPAPPGPSSGAPSAPPASAPSKASTPPAVPSVAAAAAAAAASATGTEFPEADDESSTSWRPATASGAASTSGGGATGLAITDYDELSASQVVDRLEGLPRHELEAIRDYERAHRARNTILGKIDQLTR